MYASDRGAASESRRLNQARKRRHAATASTSHHQREHTAVCVRIPCSQCPGPRAAWGAGQPECSETEECPCDGLWGKGWGHRRAGGGERKRGGELCREGTCTSYRSWHSCSFTQGTCLKCSSTAKGTSGEMEPVPSMGEARTPTSGQSGKVAAHVGGGQCGGRCSRGPHATGTLRESTGEHRLNCNGEHGHRRGCTKRLDDCTRHGGNARGTPP